jgi:murein DD-endopeptidase MepM/ murein hydrolase activator NlpD
VKRKSGPEVIHTQSIDLTIDAKALALREGKAELEVLAFDRTLWSNSTKVALPLPVDFAKPRIDVITPQQNGVEGGVELVFYKVVGKRPEKQGVEQNGSLYPGYPAALWNDSFKHYEDLYFAFFPLPIGFADESHEMKLTARDTIGNLAIGAFNYRVKKRRFSPHSSQLELTRITSIASQLASFARKNGLRTTIPLSATEQAISPDQLRELIVAVKTFDEATLSDAWTSGDGRKYWSGSFARPVTTLPSSTMGELRSYMYDGTIIASGHAPGVRFGVSTRQQVSATNGGRVAFAGELGTYGTTVVIDHGFGLTTTYSRLSELTVKVAQEVTQGYPIGRTGETGLALGEEVYYETRLHGVPVSPNEWWDSTWLEDHVQKKVSFVQGTLIGNPGE